MRHSVGRNFSKVTKASRKENHCQQGLKDDPPNTDDGLTITDFQVAPHQEKEQFPIFPYRLQIEMKETLTGLNDNGGFTEARERGCFCHSARHSIYFSSNSLRSGLTNDSRSSSSPHLQ